MSHVKEQLLWKSWATALLPTLALLLYILLHRRLPGPTAAGLSFLVVIAVSYLLFPKLKVDAVKLVLGAGVALAVGAALIAWLGRI